MRKTTNSFSHNYLNGCCGNLVLSHILSLCLVVGTSTIECLLYIHCIFSDVGNLETNSMTLTSKLTSTLSLVFTLICTSTGGPATSVTWMRNGEVLINDNNYNITSQKLIDSRYATYNHILTVTGRLVGEYECNVSNNKPSSASRNLRVVGEWTKIVMLLVRT